ncbi:MAG: sugar nucleotide-binding protein, partial [Mobilitalea sp.]
MKIVVLGSSGMLGSAIVRKFLAHDSWEIIGLDRLSPRLTNPATYIETDLLDHRALRKILDSSKPDIVINTAAIVDLNKCEEDPSLSKALHVDLPNVLSSFPFKTIYISTDSIFNGDS